MKKIAGRQPQTIGRSLDEQRSEFARGRFLAMPLAGLIAWTIIGIAGALLPPFPAVLVLFGGAGSIVYLGMFLSRFTGEHFLDRSKPKNSFDQLFFYTIAMSLLVFAIAIPFFQADYTSLPLSVGILTGLMWVPFSWIIEHWVGYLSRHCAHTPGDGGVVPGAGIAFCLDSGDHCGHLCRDDFRFGKSLAPESPRCDSERLTVMQAIRIRESLPCRAGRGAS